MLDIMEIIDFNAVNILIISIICDIFYNNYLYNSLVLLNHTSYFLIINIIGLYLFLKYFKIRIRFNLNIQFNY
jgi:hypothetical protein